MVCSPFSRRSATMLHQAPRERGLLAGFEKLLAHVDDFDIRHGPLLDALGQLDQRVLAALGVVAAFETGRGRAEHHHRSGCLGAHDGHVAAVVARRFLLLVALVVLLVDDDQAEILDRSENARARARPPRSRCRRGSGATARRARHRETRSAESPRGRRSGGRTARPSRASARSPAPATARCGRARCRRRWILDRLRFCRIRSRPGAGRCEISRCAAPLRSAGMPIADADSACAADLRRR